MKKLLLLIAATVALAAPVSARTAATTEKVPFETDVLACNGDLIHLSGTLLVISTERETPSGGFAISIHFQPQGLKGVDLVTGTMFIGTGLTRDIFISSPSGGSTETFVNQFHIQATKGEESFIVSQVFHVTVNANGDVAAFVDKFKSTC